MDWLYSSQGIHWEGDVMRFVGLLKRWMEVLVLGRVLQTVGIVASLFLIGTLDVFAAEPIQFNRDVRPILSDKCYQCHGPDEGAREEDLRLDLKEGLRGTTEMGQPIVMPGDAEESEMYYRISNPDPEERMPPEEFPQKLSSDEIDTIKRWIEEGATWQGHWAFIPPVKPALPTASNTAWLRNEIDHFILNRLDAEGFKPSEPASKETLIRRVALDLTGLPPTPEAIDEFLTDPGDDAYEQMVDRYLASPHYGERMAWPWLDAARYADTNGYQGDNERTMYPWRDWVVEAFNDNMPYDQFTIWQLAGDLLPEATREQKLATGFNRNHMINGEGGRIPEENRVEYVFDQLETVGTVWMGLTFNCCRCHDHKYDPVSNKDYYQFSAFFNQTSVTGGGGDPQTPPNLPLRSEETESRLSELRDVIKELDGSLKKRRAVLEPKQSEWEQKQLAQPHDDEDDESSLAKLLEIPIDQRDDKQKKEIAEKFFETDKRYHRINERLRPLKKEKETIDKKTVRVMIMKDMAKPRKTYILERGLYSKRMDEVTAGVPGVFADMPLDAPRNRLGLARWLVAPEHPLTSRVTVNRLWAEIFGQGLVKTTENFGVQGDKPSHPELMDWLAVTFVESGWDVKALVKRIVMSATYRQSSDVTSAMLAADPQNRYLSRGPRFRMPAWMIRDQALFAGGLLVPKLGGPPVKPYQPDGVWAEFTFGNIKYKRDTGEDLYRRSIYTYWRRIVAPPLFFDSSTRQTCTVKGSRTNTPLHALTTLNDPGFVEAARVLAERLLSLPNATDRDRIDAAFRLIIAREASDTEKDLLVRSIARLTDQFSADTEAAKAYLSVGESKSSAELDPVEHAAYASLCLALLNTDEALTKE
jgi:hypothetical protein